MENTNVSEWRISIGKKESRMNYSDGGSCDPGTCQIRSNGHSI